MKTKTNKTKAKSDKMKRYSPLPCAWIFYDNGYVIVSRLRFGIRLSDSRMARVVGCHPTIYRGSDLQARCASRYSFVSIVISFKPPSLIAILKSRQWMQREKERSAFEWTEKECSWLLLFQSGDFLLHNYLSPSRFSFRTEEKRKNEVNLSPRLTPKRPKGRRKRYNYLHSDDSNAVLLLSWAFINRAML